MEMDSREKVCGRCGHVWISHTETPVRCPNCGTYHWMGKPTVNTCVVCGHTWYSRSAQPPLRCPRCKTRSWMDSAADKPGSQKRGAGNQDELIASRYAAGDGCVKISIDTGIPLSTVIRVVKETVTNGRTPSM